MKLENSYSDLPGSFFVEASIDASPSPVLLAFNQALARELNLELTDSSDEALAGIFSGDNLPDGVKPIAMAYAGHQFGHFTPQLGDGRAALLGEVIAEDGKRYDIQLKGSGRTVFSRGGDGKSWLGPVIREYILSEAMYRLGVPTTRALAAVATGESVFREGAMPGGIFTRVASSHLRVGTFQYFAARGLTDEVKILADYAIDRHFPEAKELDDPYLGLFQSVCERQAKLVAHWMSIGFIHGVMNTDNTSIVGETIDYGPAAYMDEFNFQKVFSSIDQTGRYAYVNQPSIAQWNLARFAETLLLIDVERSELESALETFFKHFETHYLQLMRAKLGFTSEAEGDMDLIVAWMNHMQQNELDFTLSFRELADSLQRNETDKFGEFEQQWKNRLKDEGKSTEATVSLMHSVNPLFIPRNHRVEEAIAAAVNDDLSVFHEMMAVLANPFQENPDLEKYAEAPLRHERVTQTFCGT